MVQPFDPTLKTLTEVGPADWLPLARRRRRRVTIEDSDIGTIVSGAADKLFRVHDDPVYLLHLDFEAGHFQAGLPLRLRLYNSVFEYRRERRTYWRRLMCFWACATRTSLRMPCLRRCWGWKSLPLIRPLCVAAVPKGSAASSCYSARPNSVRRTTRPGQRWRRLTTCRD